jgi:hypothetical protein
MKITKEQIHKMNRKINRELEYEWHTGWVQTHKKHKTKKDYNRKSQSWKNQDWDFSFL